MAGTGATASGNASGEPVFAHVRAVADAVLYEGYLLYPYRKSSGKNRVRWQFGVLAPRDWIEAAGPVEPGVAGSAESWFQRTEFLVQADDAEAVLHIRLRFLQLERRDVERRSAGGWEPVESLRIGERTHLSFDGAVPWERDVVVPLADALAAERVHPVVAPGGAQVEQLGAQARVVRRRRPVAARLAVRAERLDVPAYRLRIRTENTAPPIGADASRDTALRHALVATHTLVGGRGTTFLSSLAPPAWAAEQVRACRNVRTFPVLADGDGRDVVLSSPILLDDHPRVAPESPGDLHDASEIDEMLSLRTLVLTEEEKREARATDPRAAAILDRVDGMPPEVLARLHGAFRDP
ncbi:hypothetical protein [Saccharopolyspora rosea]|uniref:Uncharacterized protein n=1 Tax=Saccharopolyspora rosea TaxID=524884 RepID=A0ABW3G0E0_9PSEU|nr:hypothetical protein [Saccharopolyspora rosea]